MQWLIHPWLCFLEQVEYAVNNADAGRLLQRTLNEYR